jgi:hypothetical protein
MATWRDVRETAARLPDTLERTTGRGESEWRVGRHAFVWERPLRRADLEALGDTAPPGDVLAAYVPDLVAKEALCADDPSVYFTTPHFDGYPIVLVRLDAIPTDELEELLVEAWLERAPERLARSFVDRTPEG